MTDNNDRQGSGGRDGQVRPGGRLGDVEAEARLLECLRDDRLVRWSFFAQHPLNPFVVDFYCPQSDLVVEVDASGHESRRDYELRRRELLELDGYRVLWIEPERLVDDREGVVAEVLAALEAGEASPARPI